MEVLQIAAITNNIPERLDTATNIQILEYALIVARLFYDRWQGKIHFGIADAEELTRYESVIHEECLNRYRSQTGVDQAAKETAMKVVRLMHVLVHGGIIPDKAEMLDVLNAGRDLFGYGEFPVSEIGGRLYGAVPVL